MMNVAFRFKSQALDVMILSTIEDGKPEILRATRFIIHHAPRQPSQLVITGGVSGIMFVPLFLGDFK
jgi:hypothetical protein